MYWVAPQIYNLDNQEALKSSKLLGVSIRVADSAVSLSRRDAAAIAHAKKSIKSIRIK